jgi:hypothetical protein
MGGTLKPKTKILTLTFSLVLPYAALAMYFAFRIREHPLPTWLPYFGLSYILGMMIVIAIFSRKIYRGVHPETAGKPVSVLRWLGRIWVAYLVLVWAGFFIWGAYQTIAGYLEWQRAIPAGAFLLAFIALFSLSLYKDLRGPTRRVTSTDTKGTNDV